MGYQESLIRVNCLAEIARIEKAIAESEELQTLEYLVCVCGAKAKVDLYRDNTLDYRLYPNTSHIHPYMYG